jgi:hypothetical protein
MVGEQRQQWTERIRDLTFSQHYPPFMVTLDSDHLVAEAIHLNGSGGRPIPGQVSQGRFDASGIGVGELSSIERGVQGNPRETTTAGHIDAHALQCPARLAPGKGPGGTDHKETLTASHPCCTA